MPRFIESLKIAGGFDDGGGEFNANDLKSTGGIETLGGVRAAGEVVRGANVRGIALEGLLGYWRMDSDSGVLKDYSGEGHDGDFYGSGHALAAGKFGNALSLDGNGHARGGSWIPANMGATDLSWSCWFKVGTLSDFCYMVAYYTGAGGGCYIGIGFNSTIQVRGVAVAGGASQCVIDGPAQAHDDDEWHHAVLTRDYTNEWAFYIDGALIDTSNDPGGDASASVTLNFGNLMSTTPSGRFPGTLDEISIWDRALSAQEVSALYGMRTELPVGDFDQIKTHFPDLVRDADIEAVPHATLSDYCSVSVQLIDADDANVTDSITVHIWLSAMPAGMSTYVGQFESIFGGLPHWIARTDSGQLIFDIESAGNYTINVQLPIGHLVSLDITSANFKP